MSGSTHKICPKCGTQYDRMALFCQKDGGALINPDLARDPYVGKVLLEQFRIEKLVGQGGMGAVYRARQTTIGRDVAIKILHPELTTNPDAVRRFQREARVSAALDHPNVVRVFLFGQLPEDGSMYIVMQYLRGRSLLDVTEQEAPLPPSRALHIVTQICDGIGEAHGQGVIHRDVKPENIILVQRGQDPDFVKVLDFGIARFISNEQTVATQSGLIFGTARYISPEGAGGEPTDARSDVYSIGVLLYQLLTGHTPFESTSPVALLMQHINDPAPDIRGKPGGSALPGNICDAVMRTLSKNPEGRYDDANDLAAALRNAAMMDRVVVAPPRISALPRSSAPVASPAAAYVPQEAQPPTPVTGPMRDGGLDDAPSPFTDSVRNEVPGLSRSKLGAFRTLLVAALVGAIVVVLGAFAWQPLIDAIASGEDIEELEARARTALSHGHFEKPVGENVLLLTDLMLVEEPGHAGALNLREEVARRLRVEGELERSQGLLGEARNRYRRALIFVPGDRDAHRELAELDELEAHPEPEPTPELRAVPAAPAIREPTTFFVTLIEEPPPDASPSFEVSRINARGGTEVTARPDGDRLHWVASHTFRRAGTYRIAFAAGELELAQELEVTSRAQARRDDPPSTVQHNVPPGGVSASQAVSMDDGIDWRLPEERRVAPMRNEAPTPSPPPRRDPPPPSMTTTPPAPWTSGSL